jgi:hypothetical protein
MDSQDTGPTGAAAPARPEVATGRAGLRVSHVVWIVLLTVLLTVVATYWVVRTYIYARDFQPVQLDQREQQVLDVKLRRLGYDPGPATGPAAGPVAESDQDWLRSERYDEAGAERVVSFSERELNDMIANNPDLARRLAVDLDQDLVSARLLVPFDPDFPILGGKTLRVAAGVELAFRDTRPVVVLKGVSVMGVPVPSAWLGGLKNIDLVSEFGDQGGFWQGFSEGVEDVRVEQGRLRVLLRE